MLKKITPCLFAFLLILVGCDTSTRVTPDSQDKQDQIQAKTYPDDFVHPPAPDTPPPGVANKGPALTVVVCHKYGTPAQKSLTLPLQGAMGHVQGHGDTYGACNSRIIDADGTLSPGRGIPMFIDPGLVVGTVLTPWPTGFGREGLDWFDTDGTCTWTLGDDLHVEDGATYPGAIRDGTHNDGLDPIVLDLDGSLDGTPGNEQVDVDLESGGPFTGCPGVDPLLMFHDANGSTLWENGEDIILDVDGDGTFN